MSLASPLRLNWFNLESPQELGHQTALLSATDKSLRNTEIFRNVKQGVIVVNGSILNAALCVPSELFLLAFSNLYNSKS